MWSETCPGLWGKEGSACSPTAENCVCPCRLSTQTMHVWQVNYTLISYLDIVDTFVERVHIPWQSSNSCHLFTNFNCDPSLTLSIVQLNRSNIRSVWINKETVNFLLINTGNVQKFHISTKQPKPNIHITIVNVNTH